MDPQTALYNLLDGYLENDRQAISEALEALEHWNQIQGFPPHIRQEEKHGRTRLYVTRAVTPAEASERNRDPDGLRSSHGQANPGRPGPRGWES